MALRIESRIAWVAGTILLGLLVGVAVALASSPSSLTSRHTSTGVVQPTPSPRDFSPPPSVTAAGMLGDSAHLVASGSSTLVAYGSSATLVSTDGGKTWSALKIPSGASGLAVDPQNPRHAITGGTSVQTTIDGGATWKPPQSAPPGKGPYQATAISSGDANVWFLLHQNRLLRTRDGSLSWTEISGLPALSSPVVAPAQTLGEFFLASGNRVFQLIDNGQRISEEPPLPKGAVTDIVVVDGNRPILLARTATDGDFLLSGTVWTVAGGGLAGPVGVAAGGTILVGNGGAKIGSQGLVSYSTNGGTTWTQSIGLPYDQTVEAVAGQIGSNTVFAYCYGGDIYTSTDGGRAWSLLSRALRATTG